MCHLKVSASFLISASIHLFLSLKHTFSHVAYLSLSLSVFITYFVLPYIDRFGVWRVKGSKPPAPKLPARHIVEPKNLVEIC